jgi:hypothetical protein
MAPSVGLRSLLGMILQNRSVLEHLFFRIHNRPRVIRIGGSVVKFFDMTDFTAIYNNQKLLEYKSLW